MNKIDDTKPLAEAEQQSRKPYSAPILKDLGTITELTQAVVGNPTDNAPIQFVGSVV